MQNCLLPFISKVGTGSKGAKDLTYDEARAAMDAILDGDFHPVTFGVFLLAERWKMESPEEMAGFLDALSARLARPRLSVDLPYFIDCAGSYNGKNRTLNIGILSAIIAAAAGAAVLLHGSENIPTKKGFTPGHILTQLNIDIRRTPDQAVSDLQQCRIAYLHQPIYNPALYALTDLRWPIGKRTLLNTLESLVNPLRAPAHIGGFAHRPYGELVAQSLSRASVGFSRVFLVNGIEGSDEIRPGRSLVVELDRDKITSTYIEAERFGFSPSLPDVEAGTDDIHELCSQSIDRLMNCLHGNMNTGYAQLAVLNAAFRLYASGKSQNIQAGVESAQQAIATGAAWNTLQNWQSIAKPAE